MDPYIGEIRAFTFNQAPHGWIPCDGRSLAVSTNIALYSLIGQLYGGSGQTSFNVPDLRGTAMVHYSATLPEGTRVGTETVALNMTNIPAHTHSVNVLTGVNGQVGEGTSSLVPNSFIANTPGFPTVTGDNVRTFTNYTPGNLNTSLIAGTIANAGGAQAHSNMMPYLTVQYCICSIGLFPPRP